MWRLGVTAPDNTSYLWTAPASHAENQHIRAWWSEPQDEVLARLIEQYTWLYPGSSRPPSSPCPASSRARNWSATLSWFSAAGMQPRTVPEATATGRPQRPTLRPLGTCGTHETTGVRRPSWPARSRAGLGPEQDDETSRRGWLRSKGRAFIPTWSKRA